VGIIPSALSIESLSSTSGIVFTFRMGKQDDDHLHTQMIPKANKQFLKMKTDKKIIIKILVFVKKWYDATPKNTTSLPFT